jgi:hypothetical protein
LLKEIGGQLHRGGVKKWGRVLPPENLRAAFHPTLNIQHRTSNIEDRDLDRIAAAKMVGAREGSRDFSAFYLRAGVFSW